MTDFVQNTKLSQLAETHKKQKYQHTRPWEKGSLVGGRNSHFFFFFTAFLFESLEMHLIPEKGANPSLFDCIVL